MATDASSSTGPAENGTSFSSSSTAPDFIPLPVVVIKLAEVQLACASNSTSGGGCDFTKSHPPRAQALKQIFCTLVSHFVAKKKTKHTKTPLPPAQAACVRAARVLVLPPSIPSLFYFFLISSASLRELI